MELPKNHLRSIADRSYPVHVPGAKAKDFVVKGHIWGIATEDADEFADNKVTLAIAGEFDGVTLRAGAATPIEEGSLLIYDAANKLFTSEGATEANYRAIAGLGVAVPAGQTNPEGVIVLRRCF